MEYTQRPAPSARWALHGSSCLVLSCRSAASTSCRCKFACQLVGRRLATIVRGCPPRPSRGAEPRGARSSAYPPLRLQAAPTRWSWRSSATRRAAKAQFWWRRHGRDGERHDQRVGATCRRRARGRWVPCLLPSAWAGAAAGAAAKACKAGEGVQVQRVRLGDGAQPEEAVQEVQRASVLELRPAVSELRPSLLHTDLRGLGD